MVTIAAGAPPAERSETMLTAAGQIGPKNSPVAKAATTARTNTWFAAAMQALETSPQPMLRTSTRRGAQPAANSRPEATRPSISAPQYPAVTTPPVNVPASNCWSAYEATHDPSPNSAPT